MSVRSSLFVCAVAAGCAALGLSAGRPAPAQAPTLLRAEGRYKLWAVGSSAATTTLYVLDSQTGQIWSKHPAVRGDWADLGTPAKGEK